MYSFLRIFIYIINNASKNSKLAGAVHVYMSINKQHFIILHDRISDSRQQLLYKYIYLWSNEMNEFNQIRMQV